MKKYFFRLAGIILTIAGAAVINSCVKEGNDTLVLEGRNDNNSIDNTINIQTSNSGSSDTYTRYHYNGYILSVPVHAIPKNNNGSNGQIVFSVETSNTLPAPLPSNLTQVGQVAKIEPFNFTFQYPVSLSIPVDNNFDPQTMSVYTYNESTNRWEEVPINGFGSDNTVIISSLTLGYYVIAQNRTAGDALGGIRFIHPDNSQNYFYTLTVVGYEGSNSGNVYDREISRTVPLANGKPDNATYMPYIPKGTYRILISREERSSVSSEPTSIEYYSTYVTVNVTNTLQRKKGSSLSNWGAYSGWTDITIGSGSWINGRPYEWGTPTATYGTGKFQATLTWVNTSSSSCDYDLHLYGSNGLHVCYSAKQSSAFELDRDWLHESGNAIENIYSISNTLPSGQYRVVVNLFGGATNKEFNCRVLYNGQIVASKRTSISVSKGNIEIYTFTIP